MVVVEVNVVVKCVNKIDVEVNDVVGVIVNVVNVNATLVLVVKVAVVDLDVANVVIVDVVEYFLLYLWLMKKCSLCKAIVDPPKHLFFFRFGKDGRSSP